jgi:hypothetical protein
VSADGAQGTADLLMLQSNLYRLQETGTLVVNPLRPYTSLPAIKLGQFFQKACPRVRAAPGLTERAHRCQSTRAACEAPWTWWSSTTSPSRATSCWASASCSRRVSRPRCPVLLTGGQGTVIIVAGIGSRIEIPDGTELENKVVTVGPRIVDHV